MRPQKNKIEQRFLARKRTFERTCSRVMRLVPTSVVEHTSWLEGKSMRASSGVGESGSYTKRISSQKTSGNEVYYTASSLLVILKNSCSKLQCQKFFKLKIFSYKIEGGGDSVPLLSVSLSLSISFSLSLSHTHTHSLSVYLSLAGTFWRTCSRPMRLAPTSVFAPHPPSTRAPSPPPPPTL